MNDRKRKFRLYARSNTARTSCGVKRANTAGSHTPRSVSVAIFSSRLGKVTVFGLTFSRKYTRSAS